MIEQNKIFNKKVVLVTGGSRGIGRSICIKFAELGAKVIFSYRKNTSKVKSLQNLNFEGSGQITGLRLPSLKDKDIKIFLKKTKKNYKQINFLINNIGDAIKRSSFLKSNEKLWLDNIEINLFSAVRFSKNLLKIFGKKKIYSIINIGSTAGKNGGQGDSLHYGVAKSALHTLTIGLAKELKNIRVNCVAPSAIDTSFQKRLSSKERINKIIKSTPAGRIGKADEVSNVVVFLCSEDSSYVNGEIIYVTGGRV